MQIDENPLRFIQRHFHVHWVVQVQMSKAGGYQQHYHHQCTTCAWYSDLRVNLWKNSYTIHGHCYRVPLRCTFLRLDYFFFYLWRGLMLSFTIFICCLNQWTTFAIICKAGSVIRSIYLLHKAMNNVCYVL